MGGYAPCGVSGLSHSSPAVQCIGNKLPWLLGDLLVQIETLETETPPVRNAQVLPGSKQTAQRPALMTAASPHFPVWVDRVPWPLTPRHNLALDLRCWGPGKMFYLGTQRWSGGPGHPKLQDFHFSTLSISCHSLLTCNVSAEKSADSLWGFPYIWRFFSCCF